MTKLWSIGVNTFTQTIRQPIYGILILATFGALVLTVPIVGYTMGTDYEQSDQKFLENMGLSTLLFFGILISAFAASSALSREIEDRTALTVISKPVSRSTFVLGKFGGVAVAVALAFYLCALVFLMTTRHKVMSSASNTYDFPVIILGLSALALTLGISIAGNLLFGWQFISSAVWTALVTFTLAMGTLTLLGKNWNLTPFAKDLNPALLPGMALMLMGVLVFVAIAIAVSARLGQVMTLLACFGMLVLGAMYGFITGHWGPRIFLERPLAYVLPNLNFFYPLMDKDIPADFVLGTAGYCACYIAGILSLGIYLFQRRQLESQATSSVMPGVVGALAWAGRATAVVLGLVALEGVLSLIYSPLDRAFKPAVFQLLGAAGADGRPLLGTAIAMTAAAAALAAALWIVWGHFSRATRWSYWVVLVVASLWIAQAAAALIISAFGKAVYASQETLLVHALVAATLLAILVLPGTRRHFRSAGR